MTNTERQIRKLESTLEDLKEGLIQIDASVEYFSDEPRSIEGRVAKKVYAAYDLIREAQNLIREEIECPTCYTVPHVCAGCGQDYCDCTEKEWGLGADGITYCHQDCADSHSPRVAQ
jgi:hypothetical protein